MNQLKCQVCGGTDFTHNQKKGVYVCNGCKIECDYDQVEGLLGLNDDEEEREPARKSDRQGNAKNHYNSSGHKTVKYTRDTLFTNPGKVLKVISLILFWLVLAVSVISFLVLTFEGELDIALCPLLGGPVCAFLSFIVPYTIGHMADEVHKMSKRIL